MAVLVVNAAITLTYAILPPDVVLSRCACTIGNTLANLAIASIVNSLGTMSSVKASAGKLCTHYVVVVRVTVLLL